MKKYLKIGFMSVLAFGLFAGIALAERYVSIAHDGKGACTITIRMVIYNTDGTIKSNTTDVYKGVSLPDGSCSQMISVRNPENNDSGTKTDDKNIATVREMQTALLKSGIPVTVDGKFGPQTKEALSTFQKQSGLEPSGILDPMTKIFMEARSNMGPTSVFGN